MTKYERFFKLLDEHKYDELDECDFENMAHRCGLSFSSGATRGCVIDRSAPYVIKFPLYSQVSTNYCEKEVENFEYARSVYHVEQILIPIEWLTTVGSYGMYKQQKYTACYSEYRHDLANEDKIRKQYSFYQKNKIVYQSLHNCCDNGRIPAEWYVRVYEMYGKAFLKRFENWTMDCQINDLHGSNVGYVKKQPKIFDYAGYNEY